MTQIVTVFAGVSGNAGAPSGDGGPATSAKFGSVYGMSVIDKVTVSELMLVPLFCFMTRSVEEHYHWCHVCIGQ